MHQSQQSAELAKIWTSALESKAVELKKARHSKELPAFIQRKQALAAAPDHARSNTVYAAAPLSTSAQQQGTAQTSAGTLMDHIYGEGSRRRKQREGT